MEPQKNSLAMISTAPISEPLVSSSELIRQFLVKAGAMYRVEITAPLVGVWVEVLSAHTPEVLAPLFRKVLQTFKADYGRTFPTPADVLEPIAKAEKEQDDDDLENHQRRIEARGLFNAD